MRSFPRNMAWVCLVAISLTMFGCGGGGGSSSPAMDDDGGNGGNGGDGGGGMAKTCKDGYMLDGDDCVPNAATLADRAAKAKAEAELIAGAIGPGVDPADANTDDGATGIQMPFTVDGKVLTPLKADGGSYGANEKVEKYTKSDPAPAGISGWTGAGYERVSEKDNEATANIDETKTDYVVSYTDEADKTNAAYVAFMDTGVDIDHDGDVEALTGVDVDGTTGVLTLTPTAGTAFAFAQIDVDDDFGLTAPSQTGLAIAPDQVGGDTTRKGTFYGVPGTFTCTGTCTASSDSDGKLSALGGTSWTFAPDALHGLAGNARATALANLEVPGVIEDPDYMTFGYWLRQTEGKDGTEYAMSPFAMGNRDYGGVSAVQGTATYEGSATGLYMSKELTSQGVVNPDGQFKSGQFTADARLTANFGGNDLAPNHRFSISGMISNFMDGDKAINSAWVVNLNREMFGTGDARRAQQNIGVTDNTAHGTGSTGDFRGVTDGGTLGSDPGSWSGKFYGNPGDDNAQPSSVAGIFDAHFTNGHVRGAFGATR